MTGGLLTPLKRAAVEALKKAYLDGIVHGATAASLCWLAAIALFLFVLLVYFVARSQRD